MAARKPDIHPIPEPQNLPPAAARVKGAGLATPSGVSAAPPPSADTGENSASELIEAPQRPGRAKLDPHDFADGGGGGGAEAFSRKKTK